MKFNNLLFLILLVLTSVLFGELKSGLVLFTDPFFEKVKIDFSELMYYSSYLVDFTPTLPESSEMINIDFIFSFDSAQAPFGMVELMMVDTPYIGWQRDVDSIKSFYDSIIMNNEITINNDYIFNYEIPNVFPPTSSFKIISSENHYAYFLFVSAIAAAYNRYIYYWAYDSEQLIKVNGKINHKKINLHFINGKIFKGNGILNIYTLNGKKAFSSSYFQKEINLREMKNGMYLIQFNSKNYKILNNFGL